MKQKILPYIYCVLLAMACETAFSVTTSPFHFLGISGDSAIFQTIGKYWVEGYLPYVQAWDLKGPLVFLGNYLGYLLTGSHVGVFIVLSALLSLTFIGIYRLLREGFTRQWSCVLLLLPALTFSDNIHGGNRVEEFLLPLLTLAYLLMYRWLSAVSDEDTVKHPARYALVYGMVLGGALMSRLTNAVGVMGGVAVIMVWLMAHREWRNLGHNALAFIGGFAVPTVPFIIYFWWKDALFDMWYGTVLYNLDYTAASGNDKSLAYLLAHYIDTWLLLGVAVAMLFLNPKRRLATIVWTVVAVCSLLWLLSGNAWIQYGLISLPLSAVSFLEMKNLLKAVGERRKRVCRRAIAMVVVCYVAATAAIFVRKLQIYANTVEAPDAYIEFMSDVPKTYKKSFVTFNCTTYFHTDEDVPPACRFFALQDFEAAKSKSLQHYMQEAFETAKVKWILSEGEPVTIRKMIRSEYHVYKQDSKSGLILYRRNE